MKLIIILFSLFINFKIIQAQEVVFKGNIFSKLTHKAVFDDFPIIFVKGSSILIEPDSSGYFYCDELLLNKKYHLTIMCWGFDGIEIDLNINDTLIVKNFELTLSDEYNAEKAKKDIDSNNVRLLLNGSISPELNKIKDEEFEKKYNLKYIQFGCSPPAKEGIYLYNTVIFEYLDSKYGKEWRDFVRKDVTYLKH